MRFSNHIVILILLLLPICSVAQKESGILTNTNLTSIVQSNGSLFANKEGQPVNFLDDNYAANFMRFSGSWMAGVTGDTIYANKNCNWENPQLWPGPIDTVTNLPKNAVEWSKVWTITREDVEFHRANYTTSGYTGSDFIKNWPAKHADNNISAFMAPFIDWNSNGIYDPENGDYPSFEGDYACYFIANDLFGENIFPQANKIGIEIQGLAYAYDHADVQNTIYLKLFLINRSKNNYEPFYFGQYVDYQLGDSTDNRLETDVTRNLVYGYNGDAYDEGGFNDKMPAAGCIFLNKNISASIGFIDRDSVRKLPTNEKEMLNVMKGLWPNGNPKYGVGKGLEGNQVQQTSFIYPNKTDVNLNGYWIDDLSGDDPGRRHGLGVIQYQSFKSKTYKRVDLAFVSSVSDEREGKKLRNEVDEAIAFYNKTLGQTKLKRNMSAGIYPNPYKIGVDEVLHVNAISAELIDLTGKRVAHLVKVDNSENKFKIPCSEKVSSGVYYIKAVNSNSLSISKVILINN